MARCQDTDPIVHSAVARLHSGYRYSFKRRLCGSFAAVKTTLLKNFFREVYMDAEGLISQIRLKLKSTIFLKKININILEVHTNWELVTKCL
jgi:hypothetical protein